MQDSNVEKREANEKMQEDWSYIEQLVLTYKKQFEKDCTQEVLELSKKSAEELLEKFMPLFKKYILLLKTGQIDFNDIDIKIFVSTFIEDPRLHRALKRKKSRQEYKSAIYKRFAFIKETYGHVSEDNMIIDMKMLLLILAKRYKCVGKNFCAYVKNCYRYELSRHIKTHIKDPLNIEYKNVSQDNYLDENDKEISSLENNINLSYQDNYYECEDGIPDFLWINGETCSEIFNILTPLERKIIVKYYAEEHSDKEIGTMLGLHNNTANQKRRKAIEKIAAKMNIDVFDIKRSRHSGRNKI